MLFVSVRAIFRFESSEVLLGHGRGTFSNPALSFCHWTSIHAFVLEISWRRYLHVFKASQWQGSRYQ